MKLLLPSFGSSFFPEHKPLLTKSEISFTLLGSLLSEETPYTNMPAKYTLKIYKKDGIYHIFNRGIDNRKIFKDAQDYHSFLYSLKFYLTPLDKMTKESPLRGDSLYQRTKQNMAEEIHLLSYCLLSNHFHLLLYQKTVKGMEKLMRRLLTRYVSHFNNRYKRKGPLFESVYKAVEVDNSPLQILHLSRYIHLNPILEKVDGDHKIIQGKKLSHALHYPYSSLSCFLSSENILWLKKEKVLKCLQISPVYRNFSYFQFLHKTEKGGGPFYV